MSVVVILTAGLWIGLGRKTMTQDAVALASTEGSRLRLIADSGTTLRVLTFSRPIGGVTISREAVVVAEYQAPQQGGDLFRANLSGRNVIRLTGGPYFADGEVYADPALSPNGQALAFAIRRMSVGDAVQVAGPVGVRDLRSGRVDVLPATLHQGPLNDVAFANGPKWSPDGSLLIVNFELGFIVTDGTGREVYSGEIPESGWYNAIGWIGNSCVIYIVGKEREDALVAPARVLQLKTNITESLASAASLPEEETRELVEISWPRRIRKIEGGLIADGFGRPFRIPGASGDTKVALVSRSEPTSVPEKCR